MISSDFTDDAKQVGQYGMVWYSAFDMSGHMEKKNCFFTSFVCVHFSGIVNGIVKKKKRCAWDFCAN